MLLQLSFQFAVEMLGRLHVFPHQLSCPLGIVRTQGFQ
jgi:hypothetical protein